MVVPAVNTDVTTNVWEMGGVQECDVDEERGIR